MPVPGLPPDFNKQCQECHKIINGPLEGEQPGEMVRHVSRGPAGEPIMLAEPDAEHPFNVSHGVCDDCTPTFEARYQDWITRRRAERAAEQAAAQGEEPA